MNDRRTAYWSRPTPQAAYPPLDFSVCWASGCDEPAAAVQGSRWRGVYCEMDLERMRGEVEG